MTNENGVAEREGSIEKDRALRGGVPRDAATLELASSEVVTSALRKEVR